MATACPWRVEELVRALVSLGPTDAEKHWKPGDHILLWEREEVFEQAAAALP